MENNIRLKEWHMEFIREYVRNGGNARAAYQFVRPSTKDGSARSQASALLKYDNVQEEIRKIQEEIKKSNICDINKRLEVLSEIILTGSESNRIKAIETMNKMEGIGMSTFNVTSTNPTFADLSKEDLFKLIGDDEDEEE